VPVVDRAPDDLAFLVFTAGTAGSPIRRPMLTHGNLLANIEQVHRGDRPCGPTTSSSACCRCSTSSG
jgi:long-subunit acyl-CoA synthetase (AMP-forming)